MTELNMEHNHLFALPTKNPKYEHVQIREAQEEFEAADWPKISDCDGPVFVLSDDKQYLSVYLSPENKGYA